MTTLCALCANRALCAGPARCARSPLHPGTRVALRSLRTYRTLKHQPHPACPAAPCAHQGPCGPGSSGRTLGTGPLPWAPVTDAPLRPGCARNGHALPTPHCALKHQYHQ